LEGPLIAASRDVRYISNLDPLTFHQH